MIAKDMQSEFLPDNVLAQSQETAVKRAGCGTGGMRSQAWLRSSPAGGLACTVQPTGLCLTLFTCRTGARVAFSES